ncbi:MAG: PLP-dependent aminotransferase family protein [Beijerinckiaceae bacterium]|nr:PLP-dependent aminotransferase family protein [Beijerinckiaceae bacterium]
MTKPQTLDWQQAFAGRAGNMQASEIRELLKVLAQPDIISFAGGIPDPALFPLDLMQRASADILADPASGRAALQYSVSEGYLPLREWIVGYMARRGVSCAPDNIVITAGSQQGLEFIGKLLISADDTVLVTAPTYLGALQAFDPYEPRYDSFALEADNRTPQSYRDAAAAGTGRIAFAYVVPEFANPTGLTATIEARRRLLDLAEELRIPLVEDAAYEAIRFEGDPLPSCQQLDIERCGGIDQSRVIYCGTFSKTIVPGLRIGWLCASRAFIGKIVLAKQAGDLHSPTLNQMIMHRIATKAHDAQVAAAVALYRDRRDAMLAALERYMPSCVGWTRPGGGMFIWVTLPDAIDTARLLVESLASERVAFVPGGAFFKDGAGRNCLRLNYSLPSIAEIDEGVARLGRLVAAELSRQAALPRRA